MIRILATIFLMTASFAEASDNQSELAHSCSFSIPVSGFSMKVEASTNFIEISRSAPNVRFPLITFKVKAGIFRPTDAQPEYECNESFASGYNIQIAIFNDRVHVLRSHPVMRFRALQYDIEK